MTSRVSSNGATSALRCAVTVASIQVSPATFIEPASPAPVTAGAGNFLSLFDTLTSSVDKYAPDAEAAATDTSAGQTRVDTRATLLSFLRFLPPKTNASVGMTPAPSTKTKAASLPPKDTGTSAKTVAPSQPPSANLAGSIQIALPAKDAKPPIYILDAIGVQEPLAPPDIDAPRHSGDSEPTRSANAAPAASTDSSIPHNPDTIAFLARLTPLVQPRFATTAAETRIAPAPEVALISGLQRTEQEFSAERTQSNTPALTPNVSVAASPAVVDGDRRQDGQADERSGKAAPGQPAIKSSTPDSGAVAGDNDAARTQERKADALNSPSADAVRSRRIASDGPAPELRSAAPETLAKGFAPPNVSMRSSGAAAESEDLSVARAESSDPTMQPALTREISVRLTGSDAAGVDVRLVEKAGTVHVTVRSSDGELAKSLGTNLGELVGRLEEKGYATEAWAPVEHSRSMAGTEQSGGAGAFDSREQSASGWGDPRDQQRGGQQHRSRAEWLAELEERERTANKE